MTNEALGWVGTSALEAGGTSVLPALDVATACRWQAPISVAASRAARTTRPRRREEDVVMGG